MLSPGLPEFTTEFPDFTGYRLQYRKDGGVEHIVDISTEETEYHVTGLGM